MYTIKYKVVIFSLLLIFLSNVLFSQENKTGQIEIMCSIPFINSFYSKPEGETDKFGIGFWGVSGGLGYQYCSNKYVSLLVSSQIQYEIPAPMGYDIESGVVESQESYNISLMHNHQILKMTFGYGVSYSWNEWGINYYGEDYIPPSQVSYSILNQSIGFNFNGYFQLFKGFHVGLVYRPSFLTVEPLTKLKYQHSISLDFSWRWRINTIRKK